MNSIIFVTSTCMVKIWKIKINMNKELNIDCNNLDVGNLSDTSDANDDSSADSPITVKSPVIQIKPAESTSEPNNTTFNNLNSHNNQKLKDFQKFPACDTQNHSTNKTPKVSPKMKSKSKPKDKTVKLKSKFSGSTLEFISEELKGRVFSGWVGEREYVEKLQAYRDIVQVDEWEDELNNKLKIVMHSVKGVMEGSKWINITVPSSHSSCYCLWVLLDSAPCPGHYWMQIVDISLEPQFGLKLILKILREVNSFDGETKEERERRLKGDLSPDEWKEWAISLVNFNLKTLFVNTLTLLTPSNIGSGFRLVVVLTVTLVVALATFLQYSWEFLLRLLREVGIFIHHATPFFQSVIAFFEKIVGGFYLLLAMVYKDLRQSKAPPFQPFPMQPRHLPIGPPSPRPGLTPVAYVPANNWVFHDDDGSSD